MERRGAHLSSRQGLALGLALLVALSLVIYPFRHRDFELEFLLVLPVVFAGLVGGRVAALVTALAAVFAFHSVRSAPLESVKLDADAAALVAFLGSAVAVGAAVGSRADRLLLAQQREDEQRQLRQLTEQVAAEENRVVVLEQVDRQRAAFLRAVSHDLRTPLATIRAVATDLRDDDVHDQATRVELLDSVCLETERLDRLVGKLLSMSRIEAGVLGAERQAVDLGELVHLTAMRMKPLFAHARLEVEVDPSTPLVDGDHPQLEQVLSNLLENAARHAPAGSTVTVALAERPGPQVVLRVVDHGTGIEAVHRERVFEPFWHGPGSRSSGLGLAIVRAVVDAHRGSVTITDTPGGGATVEVRLPAREDADL